MGLIHSLPHPRSHGILYILSLTPISSLGGIFELWVSIHRYSSITCFACLPWESPVWWLVSEGFKNFYSVQGTMPSAEDPGKKKIKDFKSFQSLIRLGQ